MLRGVLFWKNSIDQIAKWRADKELPPKSAKGWTVAFAVDEDGKMPALDYLEGTDSASDRDFPVRPGDVARMVGLVQAIQVSGPESLSEGNQILTFKGEDKADCMCELKLGSKNGHRLICFKRHGRRLVVASGFPKPSQPETPKREKGRAREVMRAFEEGAARPMRAFRQHSAGGTT